MNITNYTLQNRPSFGNVIIQKGVQNAKPMLAHIVNSSSGCFLNDVIKSQEKNNAADIIVTAEKIFVKDKATGDEFIPTGRVLQDEMNAGGSRVREIELEPNSARQPELTDSVDIYERDYLGTKREKRGFMHYALVEKFFERLSPNSYIVEHKPIGYNNKPDSYLYPYGDDVVVDKFNACIDIAHDIYAKASSRLSDDFMDEINPIVDNFLV